MGNPLLAGLGAAFSTAGGDVLDWRHRQRVMGMQQAQQDTQNQHNAAMLALQQGEAAEKARSNRATEASMEDLRRRQNIQTFVDAGKAAGFNYLDPGRAYAASQPAEPSAVSGQGIQGSNVMDALNQANRTSMMQNYDMTARSLARDNVGSAMLPGSEYLGGVTVENKQFSPYSNNLWRQGSAEQDQESTDFSRAMDDIAAAGEKAAKAAIEQNATRIDRVVNMGEINKLAEAARAQAMSEKSTIWGKWLQAHYPKSASLYTPESLQGRATQGSGVGAAPGQAPQPTPTGKNLQSLRNQGQQATPPSTTPPPTQTSTNSLSRYRQ